MTPSLRAGLLALALALTLPVAHAEIVVTDDAGNTLTFAEPAKRIITLAPHLAEMVFDVGAGDRLAGTVEWSDFPPAAKRVPRIGDSFRIDVERIIALRPDVVLAWGGGTPVSTIERLRGLGIPVAVLTPADLASIPRHLEWVGRITGKEDVAEQRARQFRENLRKLRARHAGREPLQVFFQVSAEPLFTVGGAHTISELIQACGGKNIFSALGPGAHAVSHEAVLARNPEVIIAGHYAGSGEALSAWRRWKNLAATRHGNLYSIDAERLSRPTLGILEGGRALCETLERARENVRGEK
ncbi:MAG TPA: cobalamin-binding protein [Gammaproteobacteria bacterium]